MLDIAKVLRMRVDVGSKEKTVDQIVSITNQRKGGYVCVSNVHMCMEVFDCLKFQKVVNNADLVVADGRPIYWAQKLLGAGDASQVRGQDLMESICRLAAEGQLKIGLYGGDSVETLEKAESQLRISHPGIGLAFSYSPPFRKLTESEDLEIVSSINNSGIDVLFVGIGCPKQEKWMAQHRQTVNCVMIGVGAALDFIAGTKSHAPRWMQNLGIEWLFRLGSEPRRLAGRYLKQNPRFIYHFTRQWLFGKDHLKSHEEEEWKERSP